MRVQTSMCHEGLRLAVAVCGPDGKLVLGKGTRLERRHLVELYDMGVQVVEVDDDVAIEPWEEVPEAHAFLRALDERFSTVAEDRRMTQLKDAVRDVYLDFLLDLEGPKF